MSGQQQKGYCKYHKHFQFPENAIGNYKAKCVYCSKMVACSDKAKTHLLNHLRDYHPTVVPGKSLNDSSLLPITPSTTAHDNASDGSNKPAMRPILPYPKLMPKLILGVSPFTQQPPPYPYTESRILPKPSLPIYSTPPSIPSTAQPVASSQPMPTASTESSQMDIVIKADSDDETWMSTIKSISPTVSFGNTERTDSNENCGTQTGAESSNFDESVTTRPSKRKRLSSGLDQQASSSKREKMVKQEELKECSISQLLDNLRDVSYQRQLQLIQHTENMNSLREWEAEIMAAISSKMGI